MTKMEYNTIMGSLQEMEAISGRIQDTLDDIASKDYEDYYGHDFVKRLYKDLGSDEKKIDRIIAELENIKKGIPPM